GIIFAIEICAAGCAEGVSPGAAINIACICKLALVVAIATENRIAPGVVTQRIASSAGVDAIITRPTTNHITAIAGAQIVIAAIPFNPVGAVITQDQIIPITADQGVATGAARNRVVSRPAIDLDAIGNVLQG